MYKTTIKIAHESQINNPLESFEMEIDGSKNSISKLSEAIATKLSNIIYSSHNHGLTYHNIKHFYYGFILGSIIGYNLFKLRSITIPTNYIEQNDEQETTFKILSEQLIVEIQFN